MPSRAEGSLEAYERLLPRERVQVDAATLDLLSRYGKEFFMQNRDRLRAELDEFYGL